MPEVHYRALNELRFVVIGAYVTDCFGAALDRRLRSTISGKFENRSESDGASTGLESLSLSFLLGIL